MSSSRWPRKLWPLALFFRMLAGCVTAPIEPQPTSAANIQGNAVQYGQWVVGCSNLQVCIAIAPVRAHSPSERQAYVEIGVSREVHAGQNMVIARNGRSIRSLSSDEAQFLLDDLAKSDGPDATFTSDGKSRFDIPRKGLAEAMSAIESWRSTPPQRLNSPDPITPLPASRINKPVIHPVLRGIAKRCPKGHMGSSMQVWRLIGGSTLWRAACGDEGLNPTSFWAVSGPQGAPPSFITFEDGKGQAQPFNSWFDESSGYLRMVHYFGHWQSFTEDCGIYRAYAWGDGEMKLVEKRYMPTCGTGIGPEGWIIVYRVPILNGPDSGP